GSVNLRASQGAIPMPEAPMNLRASHAAISMGSPGTQAMPMAGPPPSVHAPSAGAPGKKNKTVLGQVDFSSGQKPVRSIGRTPDNDIVLSHPQVSSRHAWLHNAGGQFYIEDRGS